MESCHRCGGEIGVDGTHGCDAAEVRLFFRGRPMARRMFAELWAFVDEVAGGLERSDVVVKATKSRVAFIRRTRFLWVHEATLDGIWLGMKLPQSPATGRGRGGPIGNAYGFHVKVLATEGLDDELKGWVSTAYVFDAP